MSALTRMDPKEVQARVMTQKLLAADPVSHGPAYQDGLLMGVWAVIDPNLNPVCSRLGDACDAWWAGFHAGQAGAAARLHDKESKNG